MTLTQCCTVFHPLLVEVWTPAFSGSASIGHFVTSNVAELTMKTWNLKKHPMSYWALIFKTTIREIHFYSGHHVKLKLKFNTSSSPSDLKALLNWKAVKILLKYFWNQDLNRMHWVLSHPGGTQWVWRSKMVVSVLYTVLCIWHPAPSESSMDVNRACLYANILNGRLRKLTWWNNLEKNKCQVFF